MGIIRREQDANSTEGSRAHFAYRRDIQGLRAIAIIMVVLYHMEVPGFSGGFVGVDVFFTISGFLMTAILLKEIQSTGSVDTMKFFSRRIKRLLPASMFVLASTVSFGFLFLPPFLIPSLVSDGISVATYMANIRFGRQATDYFHADDSPSPLLHYWSLSVEEQYYALWPFVLRGLVLCPKFLPAATGAFLLIFLSSFWVCEYWVRQENVLSFFLLPARAWEMASGAVLAITMDQGVGKAGFLTKGGLLSCGGLSLLASCCVFYNSETQFPGMMAVPPVLGTLLILAAREATWLDEFFLSQPLMQWIGERSYSIYLWHWPALVFSAELSLAPEDMLRKVYAIAVAVCLSVWTFKLIEDPCRRNKKLPHNPMTTIFLGIAATAGSVATLMLFQSSQASEPSPPIQEYRIPAKNVVTGLNCSLGIHQIVEQTSLFGCSVQLDTSNCSFLNRWYHILKDAEKQRDLPKNPIPPLNRLRLVYPKNVSNCWEEVDVHKKGRCLMGCTESSKVLALVGDSHAMMKHVGIDVIAKRHNHSLQIFAKGSCPPTPKNSTRPIKKCIGWRASAIKAISRLKANVIILTSAYHHYGTDAEVWQAYIDLHEELLRSNSQKTHVVIIGDNRRTRQIPRTCLSKYKHDIQKCAIPVEKGKQDRSDKLYSLERSIARTLHWKFLDLRKLLCTEISCPPVLDNILVMRDTNHLTAPFMRYLTPALDDALTELGVWD
eukprot:gb/GECG01013005.1/.p1 GENE.gb/GECG01013005.1/~~gb/GECG01013005.1/.p1  ORF type:complete len:720 (+),score=39.61 gb/GECG01013005.1/:1-2160(+)